jgi:hypothetical protein
MKQSREQAKQRYAERSVDEQISDAINSMESIYETMVNQPEWLNNPSEEYIEGFKFAMNMMNSRFFPEDVIK